MADAGGGSAVPPAYIRLLAVATALPTFSMHVFVPALPAAALALGVGTAEIQLSITLYLIGLALGQLVHGPLSDRFGRRPVLLGGLAMYLLGVLIALVASTLPMLLVGRLLQAVGGCAALVVGRAVVRETLPAAQAAGSLALLTLAITLSSALAPLAGTYLQALAGWRAAFLALLAAGGLITLMVYRDLPETHQGPRAALDLRAIGRVLLRLAGQPAFIGYSLGGATATVSVYAFYTALPFLLPEELPHAASKIGLIYLAVVAGSVIGALAARRAARRLPSERLALTGSLGTVAGALLFLIGRLLMPDSLASLVLPLFLLTCSGGFAVPGAATLAIGVDRTAVGAASSLFGTIQMTVGAVMTLLVGALGHGSTTVGLIVLGSVLAGLAGILLACRSTPPSPD